MTVAKELVTLLRYELDSRGLTAATKATNDALRSTQREAGKTTDKVDRVGGAIGRLGGALRGLVAGFSVVAIARMSDEWAGIEGRVGLVTDGIDEQKQALTQLREVAQETGQKYGAVAGLFTSVQRNAQELGLALDDTLQLSKTIGTALTIGGGSAQSQEAALIQLQAGARLWHAARRGTQFDPRTGAKAGPGHR